METREVPQIRLFLNKLVPLGIERRTQLLQAAVLIPQFRVYEAQQDIGILGNHHCSGTTAKNTRSSPPSALSLMSIHGYFRQQCGLCGH